MVIVTGEDIAMTYNESVLEQCTPDQRVEVESLLRKEWHIKRFDGYEVFLEKGYAGMYVSANGGKTTVGGYFALQSAGLIKE